jgi:hypothetical protein
MLLLRAVFRKKGQWFLGDWSHPVDTGMRGYDLPTAVKLLEIHGAVSDYLVLGTWERDRPPSES